MENGSWSGSHDSSLDLDMMLIYSLLLKLNDTVKIFVQIIDV